MSEAKMTVECFLCRNQFRFGMHHYDGRGVPTWGITICQNCESANWDGIVPRSHPRLLEHMKANGIEVRLNQKGCIDIPLIGSFKLGHYPLFQELMTLILHGE
jgi:hypothetical protein